MRIEIGADTIECRGYGLGFVCEGKVGLRGREGADEDGNKSGDDLGEGENVAECTECEGGGGGEGHFRW